MVPVEIVPMSLLKTSRLLLLHVCLLVMVSCVNSGPYSQSSSPYGGGYGYANTPRWPFAGLSTPRLPNVKKLIQKVPGFGDGSYWRGDGVPGRPRIHIVLGQQKAYFYKGQYLVGASPICSGSPAFPTPKGQFRITEKDHDHLSSVYGDYINDYGGIVRTQIDNRIDPRPPGTRFDGAKMYWFMRITGGIGMHAGYLPGYADSHGCIRLPEAMARTYFMNAPLGTPVLITD